MANGESSIKYLLLLLVLISNFVSAIPIVTTKGETLACDLIMRDRISINSEGWRVAAVEDTVIEFYPWCTDEVEPHHHQVVQ